MALATTLTGLTYRIEAVCWANAAACRLCAQGRRRTGGETVYGAAGAAPGLSLIWVLCEELKALGLGVQARR